VTTTSSPRAKAAMASSTRRWLSNTEFSLMWED
jgi:hypothetical protein